MLRENEGRKDESSEREKTSKVEIGSEGKRCIEWADGYVQRSENGQMTTITNLGEEEEADRVGG